MSFCFKNPRICKLVVTYSCNLNCAYCFEKFKSNDPQKHMSPEVAQKAILRELAIVENGNFDGLSINFFGGEPLICFDTIKQVCEWVWSLDTPVRIMISVTSNGILLTDDKKAWFQLYKDKISLSLSVDGYNPSQLLNRGCTLEQIPIEFAKEIWPKKHFIMTVSPSTVSNYAKDFIALSRHGYKLDARAANGVNWTLDTIKIYEEQLNIIGSFYLENQEYSPNPFFLRSFTDQLAEQCDYFCGAGHHIGAYDYSGKCYPCHMFMPIVWGEDISDKLVNIDFEHPLAGGQDPECAACPLVKCCPTCVSDNLQYCGDPAKREKSGCEILKAEIRAISAFQIKYYMNKKDSLSRDELVKLKAAYEIYQVSAQ